MNNRIVTNKTRCSNVASFKLPFRWLLLAVWLLGGGAAMAQSVNRETARSVAETFFNGNVREGQTVHFADITAETPFQNFYIFSADSSFVIVAADERVTPILGYSKTNRFVTENMPENLRWWLEGYDAKIQTVRENAIPATNEISEEWRNLIEGAVINGNRSTVGPLLTTEWGQCSRYPEAWSTYNYYCPQTPNPATLRCPTGCVATAMAQIMNYWEHPVRGVSHHCYIPHTHPEYGQQCAYFDIEDYDWENMPDVVNVINPIEEIMAVAKLMYHCGVAVDMDYAPGGSGAQFIPTISAFKTYFKYSEMARGESKDWYSDEQWRNLLKAELNHGRPVYYTGDYYNYDGTTGSHAFVCDGYDDNNQFHFNWGWRGDNNGYFVIGSLNPGAGGTGSGEGTYNDMNHIIVGLEPVSDDLAKPMISLVETSSNTRTVRVTWNAVVGASYYRLYRDGEVVSSYTIGNTFTDTNVPYGEHTYRVVAVDGNGFVSVASDIWNGNIAGPTPKPIGLACSITGNNVELSWNAPSNGEDFIAHHPQSVSGGDIQSMGTEDFDWLERFMHSEMNAHYNKHIDKVGVYVQNSNVVHDLTIYRGNFSYRLMGASEIAHYQFVPSESGWYYLTLANTIPIPSNEDIWIEMKTQESSNSASYAWVGGELPVSFVDMKFGDYRCLYSLSEGLHWLIDLHVSYANGFTYNVYRNDVQNPNPVCIAENVENLYYIDNDVPYGNYVYYVTTNYFNGESAQSNIQNVDFTANYTITLNASPTAGGTISGGGTYPAGSVVTVSAHANSGYRFNGWVENGEVVAVSNNYMFNANADRDLTATFVSTQSGIGSVVINADGSQGVLYHIDASGVGWMVALDDASESCTWGPTTNIQLLPDRTCDNVVALEDVSGFMNTGLIRTELGTENDYAASQVDFDHGWYLPSAGQLRKLYSALPFIDSVLYQHGGSTISEDTYWSSTEYSSSNAASPMFAMSNSSKSSNHRVRAIRNYYSPQDNTILAMPDSPTRGEVMNYHNGVYSYGENAAVVATPKPGYLFDHWSEEGLPVSYNRNYTFTFTHSRRLIAHFVVSGGIGTVVHNADGSDGVVFYVNTDGTEGLMVALEDSSEGCQWGTNSNIIPLNDRPLNGVSALEDVSGFHNTGLIRTAQNADSTVYAAGVVDYENGWYLPAAGELRKLYAALPLIETALVRAGGSTLTEGTYWSSTEYSTSDASTPMFSMGNTSKTSTCRVRAIRKFLPSGIHSLVAKSQDTIMGTASGSGTYDYNAIVTVSAVANEGFVFESWTEEGMVVSYDATYQFPFTRNRVLVANFRVTGTVGEIVHNADGSTGVVFYQNAEGTEGWMVALEDASEGCQWGPQTNINAMPDMPYNDIRVVEDVSGYRNTDLIRKVLGTNNDYAASVVDFDNGWYLPAAGQLRKLYAALPMIEESILNAGGTLLTEDAYWSSSEYNTSDAFSPMFAMSNASKTSSRRVRAIRTFNCSNTNVVRVMANNVAFGSVAGGGNYEFGASVSVLATPKPNYAFDHWEEDGCTVSYDRYYTFEFTRTRTLVAIFVRENSIGSIVHNDDGSVGIVFYKYPIGEGGLMVALEDASEGCPWGRNEDVSILQNWSPDAVAELLKDMNGKNNTMRIRAWYDNNTDYAAGKVDYDNGWFLPSAGQLRKLYAALPMIEDAIIQAGGSTLTEGTYWSSTEQSASNAWTPSFAMNSTNKTNNCRVRAIRSLPNTTCAIDVTANLQDGGSTSGSGVYDYGQLCTLKAVANPTYAFQCWKKNGVAVSTNMEYSFTVTGNQTYVACFVENSSNIITSADPSWMGTTSGAGVYTIGTTCTLTAIPYQGYSFVNWTKGGSVVSTDPSYSFTVTEPASYCAHFVITSYTISATANPTGGGTVTGTGSYYESLTCTLTATANTGYTFLRWTENGQQVSTNPSYTFTVTRDRTLVAQFQPLSYTISASANPSNGGTVNGGGAYDYGTTCTVTAAPASGYYFMNWTKDGEVVSINTSYSFTVTRDAVLVSNFTTTRYTVTVAASDPSQGTVGGGGAYVYGHTCTVTATPADGYCFINWTQNGEVVSTTETYTFTVEANTTLVAHFSAGSVIGDGGGATNENLPSHSYYKYTLSQQIYTAEELGDAGIITSIAFYNGGSAKTRIYDFYLKRTTKTSFSGSTDWVSVTDADKVFSGTVTMTSDAWTIIIFDTPYIYDGNSNVILVADDNTGSFSSGMACRVFEANSQALYVRSDGTNYTPSNPSSYSGTVLSVKNQLRFTKEAFGDCMPPTLLTATEVGAHFVELSWTELGTSEQWVVYCNNLWTTANTNENFRLEGLDSETEYAIKVRPICDDDLWSNTITVTTLEACPAPRNVDVGNITPVAATVIWDGYSDSYNVQVGRTNIVLHVEEFSDGIPADWNNTSNYPWTVVDGHIQSGNGGISSSTSSISVTVNIPEDGTISFDYWSRGEGSDSNDWDKSRFYIDDEKMFDYGKHTEWESYSTTVSAGTHTFRWEYKKDSSVNPDGDYFAVDNVEMKMGEIVWNAPVSVWDDVYSFTGLNPATTYCVRVQGVCGDIETDWSEGVFFTTFEGSTVYTFTKEINAYTADGGYYLIAVPLDEVNPEEVDYMLDNIYDLYEYDEAEELEWRNHKDNAFNLELGKGYLYANSEDVTLTFTGVPNSNNCTVTLKKTSDAETAGWNLVGNPFNQRAYLNRDFYVMNDDGSEIVAAERNYIMPMEGVFVVANYNGESLTFTQAKSANDNKRIVFNLSQDQGTSVIDRAIVRFGEGSGLPKFQINESSTKLFIHQDGKDYAVVCAKEQGEIPLNFKASEDGAYTLTVSGTLNSILSTLNFSYLHLIDNLTGEDVDLLATPSYTFEAKTTDSASRFVLVIRTSM